MKLRVVNRKRVIRKKGPTHLVSTHYRRPLTKYRRKISAKPLEKTDSRTLLRHRTLTPGTSSISSREPDDGVNDDADVMMDLLHERLRRLRGDSPGLKTTTKRISSDPNSSTDYGLKRIRTTTSRPLPYTSKPLKRSRRLLALMPPTKSPVPLRALMPPTDSNERPMLVDQRPIVATKRRSVPSSNDDVIQTRRIRRQDNLEIPRRPLPMLVDQRPIVATKRRLLPSASDDVSQSRRIRRQNNSETQRYPLSVREGRARSNRKTLTARRRESRRRMIYPSEHVSFHEDQVSSSTPALTWLEDRGRTVKRKRTDTSLQARADVGDEKRPLLTTVPDRGSTVKRPQTDTSLISREHVYDEKRFRSPSAFDWSLNAKRKKLSHDRGGPSASRLSSIKRHKTQASPRHLQNLDDKQQDVKDDNHRPNIKRHHDEWSNVGEEEVETEIPFKSRGITFSSV